MNEFPCHVLSAVKKLSQCTLLIRWSRNITKCVQVVHVGACDRSEMEKKGQRNFRSTHYCVCVCFSTSLSSGKAMRKSSHLLDDCLMRAVVFTQQDPAWVLRGIVLVEPVQQGHMEVSLPCKLAVHKRTELQRREHKTQSKGGSINIAR